MDEAARTAAGCVVVDEAGGSGEGESGGRRRRADPPWINQRGLERGAATAAVDEVTGRPRGALLVWTRPHPQQVEEAGPTAVNCGNCCERCGCQRGRGGEGEPELPLRTRPQHGRKDRWLSYVALQDGRRGCRCRRGCAERLRFRRGHGTSISWTWPRRRPWGDVVCRRGRGGVCE